MTVNLTVPLNKCFIFLIYFKAAECSSLKFGSKIVSFCVISPEEKRSDTPTVKQEYCALYLNYYTLATDGKEKRDGIKVKATRKGERRERKLEKSIGESARKKETQGRMRR